MWVLLKSELTGVDDGGGDGADDHVGMERNAHEDEEDEDDLVDLDLDRVDVDVVWLPRV